MKLKLNINKPYMIFLYTNLLSFFFWILPDFNILRSGFEKRAVLFSKGGMLLIYLYTLLFISSYIGFNLKKNFSKLKRMELEESISSDFTYLLFFILGTIGVIFTYYKIIDDLTINGVFSAIKKGNANLLKLSLYKNYHWGIYSLRYVCGQTFALTLIRRMIYQKRKILDIFVTIELFLVILISARIIFIYSLISFLIFYIEKRKIKINFKFILATLGIILILFILNYSRNKSFYNTVYKLGFWGAGISEIKAYLGAPFQGALIAAEKLLENKNLTLEEFYNYSTIERGLTTNSALLEFYFKFKQIFSIQFIFILIGLVGGSIARIFYNLKNSSLFFSYITILYCFAELWRLFLFDDGIVKVWIIIPIIIILFDKLLKKYKK